jgi:hypothetical protein
MVPARSRSWPPALNYALPSRRGLSCNKRGFQPPSVPCTLIFNEQDAAYQQAVLGDTLARVAVEAAVQMSWDRYLGLQGCFVGMRGFGESGKICRCLQEVRHHHRSGGARRPRESEIGLRSIGTSWFRRAQFCQYKEGRHDQRIATTRQHRSRRLVGRSQSDADKIWKAGRAGRAQWGRRGHHQPPRFSPRRLGPARAMRRGA